MLRGGIDIKIGFELNENRAPVIVKTLSLYEAMLFISIKVSELVSSLEKLGVELENYLEEFSPEAYSRKYSSG